MTFHPGHTTRHYRPHQPYWDRAWLEAEYVGAERSAVEIAAQFRITIWTVYGFLRKHGIERRTISASRRATIARSKEQR